MLGLEPADRLGAFEALGQQMDQRGIDVVDAVAQPQQFRIARGARLNHSKPFPTRKASVIGEA